MRTINWEAELTCNDLEDGDRKVTITKITFEIPDDPPEVE